MTRDAQISIERSFRQSDFDRFARLSGDDNPIHVDPDFSARTRFDRPVAHGLLLCSVLRGLIEKLVPGGRLADQSLMFPAPTYTDEPMRFVVTRSGNGDSGSNSSIDLDLEIVRIADGITTCKGHAKVMK